MEDEKDQTQIKHVRVEKTKNKDLSSIKNKIIRNELYRKEKHLKSKERRKRREKRKREGDCVREGVPKQVTKTLDNTRLKDDTWVEPDDEEVMQDEMTDEYADYFKGERNPKILFTTCTKPKCHDTMLFIKDLLHVVPNSEYKYRKGIDIKKLIPQAIERGFTDIVVINEDHKAANGIFISHLPHGPTAHFKISSVKRCKKIKNHGRMSGHRPELILNNFNTRLGHSVARILAGLFPYNPEFQGRRAVTFHNQRDFIFFRQHRYIFKNKQKAGLQELGPRFTLKLRSIQKGTFNSMFGEYEWIHKRKEMDTSRRKFHL